MRRLRRSYNPPDTVQLVLLSLAHLRLQEQLHLLPHLERGEPELGADLLLVLFVVTEVGQDGGAHCKCRNVISRGLTASPAAESVHWYSTTRMSPTCLARKARGVELTSQKNPSDREHLKICMALGTVSLRIFSGSSSLGTYSSLAIRLMLINLLAFSLKSMLVLAWPGSHTQWDPLSNNWREWRK